MSTPELEVREVLLYERDTHFRLPFRFGAATLTEAPQAFARVRIGLPDGRSEWGAAAELMVPKWFDKDPARSAGENLGQLRLSCALASAAYCDSGMTTAFGISARSYHPLREEGARKGLNPLTVGFGAALLDRAVLDAFCRLASISFYDAIRANMVGLSPAPLADDLANFDLDGFLASLHPASSIAARHTVGMLDPLTTDDQSTSSRVRDGLPETLEEVIAKYGNRHFKVKLSGHMAADLDRLDAVAALLGREVPEYRVTLDGNEQYVDVDGPLDLLRAIRSTPRLQQFQNALLYFEQPIARSMALNVDITDLADICPVILDESDDGVDVFLHGTMLGYTGISSKTCKGMYKSILNAARCAIWNRPAKSPSYFISGEDLTCQAGISVQQDLALVSLLGIDHVERNGHHYVNGMAGAGAAEQHAFQSAHPDLYRDLSGGVGLAISNGRLAIASLACDGYASKAEPDWASMRMMMSPVA